jgi:Flp pilus assembly protein TadB
MSSYLVLAALAGALLASGLIAVIAYARGTDPDHAAVAPPSRLAEAARAVLAPHRRRRVAAAVTSALAVLAITRWPVAALATGIGILATPALLSQRPAQRRIARLEALEQWTRRLADVLAASRGLEDTLTASARKAPAPIEAEVHALARRLRARMPAGTAIRLWADELADPTADRIAAALLLADRRRGAGVRPVLSQLADQVGKDVAARREIEASRAEHRTTLRWVLVFLAGYTVIIALRPSYSAPFSTLTGQSVMAVIALLYGAGLFWIHQLARGEKPPRLLTPLHSDTDIPSASEGSGQ